MSLPRIGRHGQHTIPDEVVKEILELYDSTVDLSLRDPERWSVRKLADKYPYSRNTIWRIVTRRSYEWVTIEHTF